MATDSTDGVAMFGRFLVERKKSSHRELTLKDAILNLVFVKLWTRLKKDIRGISDGATLKRVHSALCYGNCFRLADAKIQHFEL